METASEGYEGAATVFGEEGHGHPCRVELAGAFAPLFGHYRWSGAIWVEGFPVFLPGRTPVVVVTPEGWAGGIISGPDPWGRLHVQGRGRPPFGTAFDAMEVDGAEVEAGN